VDMAPVMMARADTPLCPKGATGFGVRLLADWVLNA
jgi:leucyl aminopeptidase